MSKAEYTTPLTYHGLRNKSKDWLIEACVMLGKTCDAHEQTHTTLSEEVERYKLALRNCRGLAIRNRNHGEWAEVSRICLEAGIKPTILRKVDISELSNIKMIAGNEEKYKTVIHNGVLKEWVGIGWVDIRTPTDEDREKYPEVVW